MTTTPSSTATPAPAPVAAGWTAEFEALQALITAHAAARDGARQAAATATADLTAATTAAAMLAAEIAVLTQQLVDATGPQRHRLHEEIDAKLVAARQAEARRVGAAERLARAQATEVREGALVEELRTAAAGAQEAAAVARSETGTDDQALTTLTTALSAVDPAALRAGLTAAAGTLAGLLGAPDAPGAAPDASVPLDVCRARYEAELARRRAAGVAEAAARTTHLDGEAQRHPFDAPVTRAAAELATARSALRGAAAGVAPALAEIASLLADVGALRATPARVEPGVTDAAQQLSDTDTHAYTRWAVTVPLPVLELVGRLLDAETALDGLTTPAAAQRRAAVTAAETAYAAALERRFEQRAAARATTAGLAAATDDAAAVTAGNADRQRVALLGGD